jgi:hypothetical protein
MTGLGFGRRASHTSLGGQKRADPRGPAAEPTRAVGYRTNTGRKAAETSSAEAFT